MSTYLEQAVNLSFFSYTKVPENRKLSITECLLKNESITTPDKKVLKIDKILALKGANESGTSDQVKVLLDQNNTQFVGRVKSINNMNEAITYHKLTASKDPLLKHIPKFLGVLDTSGKQIDLGKEIEELGEEQVRLKYQSAYLIMNDLLEDLKTDGKEVGEALDLKFAKPTLVANEEEEIKHQQTRRGYIYNWIKKGFFRLSNCAFAFQESTTANGWLAWMILAVKRMFNLMRTREKIVSLFDQMQAHELKANIESLVQLNLNLEKSKFTFIDSSLLFIPVKQVVNGTEMNQIDIKLIDLAYGMHQNEQIHGFAEAKADMIHSVKELIDMLKSMRDHRIEQA